MLTPYNYSYLVGPDKTEASLMNSIETIDLFPTLDTLLISVLKSLTAEDWQKQTIAPRWTVKDIAVHLLDGNMRTLSMLRDNYFGETPENIDSYQSMVAYLNRLNADWVIAMKRISPPLLIELLESTGKQYYTFLKTLNPDEVAAFSVAWAGEKESKNWFHIAREYTEKWHHQQQIRLAVGQEKELYAKAFYWPYLETSMRALPHHYSTLPGLPNDVIKFTVRGESTSSWYLYWQDNQWELGLATDKNPNCEVILAEDIAWRIFTKGIRKEEAMEQSTVRGNQALGNRIFDMIAVMA